MWHASIVPNAVIGLLVAVLAILLRWYLRRARQRQNSRGQESAPPAPTDQPGSVQHTESLTRATGGAAGCGTIDTVTPLPAPTSIPHADTAPGSAVSRPQPAPALVAAVEIARSAVEEVARGGDDPLDSPVLTVLGDEDPVGAHAGIEAEGPDAATHFFEAHYPGYRGWRWAVTVASAGPDEPVTVSEVVLVPGPDALTAPEWLPWHERLRPGDLGVGDLLPSAPDDPRLAAGPSVVDDPLTTALGEVGRGRARVLSLEGRSLAAARWLDGEFGPSGDLARLAPGACATCGFYVPLTGPMGSAFGVCGNELSPADGRAVHAEFGCGAHSQAEVDTSSTVPVAEVVYDDAALDFERHEVEPGDG